MNKKKVVIAFLLLVFLAVGAVFAETLQCKDPADGTISISILGDLVRTTYSGKSAQSFQVIVLLKDGTTQILTFSYPRVGLASTRLQTQQARGPIDKVYNCSFTAY